MPEASDIPDAVLVEAGVPLTDVGGAKAILQSRWAEVGSDVERLAASMTGQTVAELRTQAVTDLRGVLTRCGVTITEIAAAPVDTSADIDIGGPVAGELGAADGPETDDPPTNIGPIDVTIELPRIYVLVPAIPHAGNAFIHLLLADGTQLNFNPVTVTAGQPLNVNFDVEAGDSPAMVDIVIHDADMRTLAHGFVMLQAEAPVQPQPEA